MSLGNQTNDCDCDQHEWRNQNRQQNASTKVVDVGGGHDQLECCSRWIHGVEAHASGFFWKGDIINLEFDRYVGRLGRGCGVPTVVVFNKFVIDALSVNHLLFASKLAIKRQNQS
jgi:hypothetical protein